MIAFLVGQAALFLLLAGAVLLAGAPVARHLAAGSRAGRLGVTLAAGLLAWGTALGALGYAGALLPLPMAALCALFALTGGAALRRREVREALGLARPEGAAGLAPAARLGWVLVPLFVLALYPPLAFDETLYHLPTVEAFARSGALPVLPTLRVPVFPHLAEVLQVPLFLAGGDVATHLLPLLSTAITALLVFAWAGESASASAGELAAALFLSAPIVVALATTGYVEALLTTFVTAALYALDRWRREGSAAGTSWLLLAAASAGGAAGVKYLGLYWLAVAGLGVLAFGRPGARLRGGLLFGAVAAAVALPWYARIVAHTGNPLFPFLPGLFGHTIWDHQALPAASLGERLVDFVRIPWDTLFARHRTGLQPPFSPALALALPAVALGAVRHRPTRALALLVVAWATVWVWLPRDARFLTLVLPLTSVAAGWTLVEPLAKLIADLPVGRLGRHAFPLLCLLALATGPLYAGYRFWKLGPLPHDAAGREALLARELVGYEAVAHLDRIAREGEVAFLCGEERLAYHFLRGELVGDHTGPAAFDRLRLAPDADALAARLAALGAGYVVRVPAACPWPLLESGGAAGLLRRIHADGEAEVYRVLPAAPGPSG